MPSEIINRSYYDAIQRGRDDKQREEINSLNMRATTQNMEHNALADRHAVEDRESVNKKAFATQMVQAAQYALQSPDPKAFIQQHYPQLAAQNPTFQTDTPEQIKESLQDAIGVFGPQAGIGPAQPKTPESFTLSEGQTRYGPDGKPIASVAPKPVKPPATFRAMTQPEMQAAGLPAGTSAQINDDTKQIQILTQPGAAGKLTEGERGAANYLGRMEAAEKLLDPAYVPSVATYMAAKKVMSGGGLTSSVANKFLSAQDQKYYQAASDWVRAKLRKESGAAIGVDEMENEIKTYFPMPGDAPEVLAQKAQARAQATDGMRGMSGRAATAPAGNEPTATGPNGQKIVYRNGQWQPL